jgi:heme/copper-type cytochrome/quinol oxidase subunit 3
VSSSDAPVVAPFAEFEPPEILSRNLQVGARMLAAAQAFALLSFVFAYFYLRTLNSNGAWRPHGVNPPGGVGVAMVVCLLGSGFAYWWGVQRLGDGTEQGWRVWSITSLVLGVAAFVLIIVAFASISFGPTSGGYASVFVGWNALYGINLLLVLIWLETLVAQSLHTHTQEVAPETSDIAAPFEVIRPAGDAFAIVLYMSVLFGVIGWLLLYVI